MRDPPEHHTAGELAVTRFDIGFESGEQVDAREVREFGDRHLQQLTRGSAEIQRAADPAGGLVEQHQALARPELLGRVVGDEGDTVHRAVGVLQGSEVDGPRMDPSLAPCALETLQVHRLAVLQRAAQSLGELHGLRLGGDVENAQATHRAVRQADDGDHGLIGAAVPELRVVQRDRAAWQLLQGPPCEVLVLGPGIRPRQRAHDAPAVRRVRRVIRCFVPRHAVMRDHGHIHALPVAVPQGERATQPFRVLGQSPSYVVGCDGLDQQVRRRPTHDLLGGIAQ